MTTSPQVNDHLVLIVGESSTGKSACLRELDHALYINCESGKKLPFKPKNFKNLVVNDPMQVYDAFLAAEQLADYPTIVVDGLNFLMDMYESTKVLPSTNTMQAWGSYAQYFKNLMQQYVSQSTKAVIFTAHTKTTYNESALAMETKVPIKGSLANQGIEAYFSCVLATKKVKIKDLEGYENGLLTITDRERALGFKHVFQTNVTATTVQERIRSPMGLFSDAETFIDNDIALVIKRLQDYYAD